MKKIVNSSVLIALLVTMLAMTSSFAYASTIPTFPYTASNQLHTTQNSWKTVAYSSEGFSCTIVVAATTQSYLSTDIQMLDQYGNVVWQQNNAISSYYPVSFYCGSNVYTVRLRTSSDYYGGYAWAGYVG